MNVLITVRTEYAGVKVTPRRIPHLWSRADETTAAGVFRFDGASCSVCGELTPGAFAGYDYMVPNGWPMECTERFAREELTHYNCGGRIMLADVRRC